MDMYVGAKDAQTGKEYPEVWPSSKLEMVPRGLVQLIISVPMAPRGLAQLTMWITMFTLVRHEQALCNITISPAYSPTSGAVRTPTTTASIWLLLTKLVPLHFRVALSVPAPLVLP